MNLLDFKNDKHSFVGEDGIIEKILKIMNIKEGFFIEIGASDGIKGSNCRKLWEEGWHGFCVEGDEKKFKKLRENYKNEERITTANIMVGTGLQNSFDYICHKHIPDSYSREIDFCSIDIDGLDVEFFETAIQFKPKVVCIEGGQMLHPFMKRLPINIAKENIQQSLSVMEEIFEKKGYKLLCSYQDSFFVRNDFWNLFHNLIDNYKFIQRDKRILNFYLDGLSAIPKRIPYIKNKLNKVQIRNSIINRILKESNYKKYKWFKRKKWAKKENSKILEIIKEERRLYNL